MAKVNKIGTQGRYNVGQWITKYIVSYSIDGGFFEYQLHKPYHVPRVSITNEAVLHLYKVYLARQVHNNCRNVSNPIGHAFVLSIAWCQTV